MQTLLLLVTQAEGTTHTAIGMVVSLMVLVLVPFLMFFITAVAVLRNGRLTGTEKTLWVVLLFFFNFFAVFAYLLMGRKGCTTEPQAEGR